MDKNQIRLESGTLIVCNHVSYLDILIIASKFPTCFVTSNEMKETPGLGLLCKLGGCVFVERRSRKNIESEVDGIKIALQKGLCVMFFPEATSTSGVEVIPFKRSLFHAAVTASSDVLPLCLNYITVDGEDINAVNKDLVFWYGDMDFSTHFSEFCKLSKVEVNLSILELIKIDSVSHDSKLLRDTAYELISSCYKTLK